MRRLVGHKEATLTLLIVFLWLGLVAGLWIGYAAFTVVAIAYIAAAEPPKQSVKGGS